MANRTAIKPIVKLKLEPGPVSPAQKQAWLRFWTRIVSQVMNERQAGER